MFISVPFSLSSWLSSFHPVSLESRKRMEAFAMGLWVRLFSWSLHPTWKIPKTRLISKSRWEAIEIWAWYTRQVHLVAQRPSIPGGKTMGKMQLCTSSVNTVHAAQGPSSDRLAPRRMPKDFSTQGSATTGLLPFWSCQLPKNYFWLFLFPNTYSLMHRFIFKKQHKQHPATSFHQSWHLFVGLPQPLQAWPHLWLLVAADECRGDWSWKKTCASRESGGSHLTSGPLAEDLAGKIGDGLVGICGDDGHS